jgi:hypothetical protein
VIGAIAMSSWSAKPFVPFDLSTLITVQVEPPILIRAPSGFAPGSNRSSTTVWPRITTLRCSVTSSSVNDEPLAISRFRTAR